MSLRRSVVGALALAALVPACTAILGLPDPMVDPNFGRGDGSLPDGFVDGVAPPNDGDPADGGSDGDGGNPADSGPGKCDGACLPVVFYQQANLDPRFIEADTNTVYVASGGAQILAIDVNTKVVTAFTAQNEPFINDLRLDGNGNFVYFTNLNVNSQPFNGAARCPKAGCDAGPRTDYVKGATRQIFGVAFTATNAFFSYDETVGNTGGIYQSPIAGGAPTKVLGINQPTRIVSDGTSLFWISDTGAGIFTCTAANCTSSTGGGASAVVDLAVNSSYVYFVDRQNVLRTSKTMTNPIPIAPSPQVDALTVRADNTYVYWLNEGKAGGGSLRRCPATVDCATNPTKLETLAINLTGAFGLAVATDAVYFTTRPDNTIWRVSK